MCTEAAHCRLRPLPERNLTVNLTYNITTVLANFDALNPVLLVSYGLTLACFVVYYIAAIVKGFKDKHCGMPWQTNMWNMSNDFLFVFLGFPYWWTEGLQTNHWFTHVIWVGMVAWFAAELICHWQAIRWDLGEIFPHAKKRSTAIACYVGAQVVFVACYYWIWSSIDDPLVQVMIATTVIFCTLFVPQFLSVRNSTRGVSAAALWAVLIAQVAWWFFAIPAMDPAWGTIYTYFFGACGVAVGIVSLWKYYQLKKLA